MLKRKHRVGREYFAEVMKSGFKISTPFFLVRYKRNSNSPQSFKCSVVVSKKVARRAVDRNNFRRRTYYAIGEVIKNNQFPPGSCLVIFFIKSNLKKISFEALKLDVGKVFDVVVS